MPFDYQTEADKTCSVVFNPHNVNYETFLATLRTFSELAGILNLYKKLLFRGKMPEALNMPTPELSESLAGNGGHISPLEIDLVHGIVGIATESGEAVDILIALLEGQAPDRVNAVEEVGDISWYQNRILRWAGVTFEQSNMMNIDKLHGRGFAEGFDMFRDANRDLARERSRLESEYEAAQQTIAFPCTAAEMAAGGCVERKPVGDTPGMDC